MTMPLKVASLAFPIALVVAVASGLFLIWSPARTSVVVARILGSSVVVLLAASLYIAVCDALARINAGRGSSTLDTR